MDFSYSQVNTQLCNFLSCVNQLILIDETSLVACTDAYNIHLFHMFCITYQLPMQYDARNICMCIILLELLFCIYDTYSGTS